MFMCVRTYTHRHVAILDVVDKLGQMCCTSRNVKHCLHKILLDTCDVIEEEKKKVKIIETWDMDHLLYGSHSFV